MLPFVYVSIVVIGLLFVASLLAVIRKDRRARKRLGELNREYESETVLASTIATFAGRASRGSRQPLGTGPLLLTSRRLLFELTPARSFAISTNAIQGAEVIELKGGKRRALQVAFTDGCAELTDVALWVLPGVDEWAEKIGRARNEAAEAAEPTRVVPWEHS